MMAKSSASRRSGKPAKPYPGFPLFPHATGRWAKKIRGKIHYFGQWAKKAGGELVAVDDMKASAAAAKLEFDRVWPYLSEGRTPPPADAGDACTVRVLCNAFLGSKETKLNGGELSSHSFSEYFRTCDRIVTFFGAQRRVDDLRPADFESFRASLAEGCNVVTVKSKINRVRVVFKFASDNRLIDRPVEFGQAFNRPSAKLLRKARNDAGGKSFEADEIKAVLAISGAVPRAMVLLGINCGFGNTDVADLPRSAVDLERGWVAFPRPKTEIRRRIPLWPETVAALAEAFPLRPDPADPSDGGLCFLTERGNRFVRVQKSKKSADRHVTINTLSHRFDALCEDAGVEQRRGRGFYGLRHTFETVAGECRDQVAVDAIMGHVDPSMAAIYRDGISDDRLLAAVNTVRSWLWPASTTTPETGGSPNG